MSIKIAGLTGLIADVDANNYLSVVTPQDVDKAGLVVGVAEVHDGIMGENSLRRSLDASPDYRLRVGSDSPFWDDTFSHTVLNTSKYQAITSTMTISLAGGKMVLNAGNSVASGTVARVQTYRTFPLFLSYALYFDSKVMFTQSPILNNVCEWGLGFAATTLAPTDGAYFRLGGSGLLLGCITNAGAEITVPLDYVPLPNISFHSLIVIHNDRTEFWINDSMYGSIETPPTLGSPMQSMACPILLRNYNAALTTTAQNFCIQSLSVNLADMQNTRLWATTQVAMGNSSINAPDGSPAGQTANHSNNVIPATATLSNTTASYSTMGGKFYFAAPLGSETDYALFAYLNPVSSNINKGKTLIVRGVRIETYNVGVAVATTPTVLEWALGVGSTGISLVTADSATAGTRSPRRLSLGIQSFVIGSLVGSCANAVDVNLDAPVIVESGTYLHIMLKVPYGTATASEFFRGSIMINGYFE